MLREADVAVVGGSFAGVAAALGLARAGRSAVLVEPRTYLGRELTATLRPWLAFGGEMHLADLPALIRACIDASGTWDQRHGGEVPLHPDRVKRALEDALLAAGVGLLYGSLPVALKIDGGTVRGLVIGNKSGHQLISCVAVVDATETLLAARLAGASFVPATDPTARYRRTLEFDRVRAPVASTLAVPPALAIAGNTVRVHRGYRGPEHVLVECPLELAATDGPVASTRREFAARTRTTRLAMHLLAAEPAFTGARLAGSSYELHGPTLSRIADPPGTNAVEVEVASPVFAGPVPGLWCLSEAQHDPIAAVHLGDEIARALLNISKERPHPPAPSPNVGGGGASAPPIPLSQS